MTNLLSIPPAVSRTTDYPVRWIKASRPRKLASVV
jgi:hypothetical protein